ncbi:MAG: sugar kinase [Rhodospirillaceae bacterium]|nr:sugar kinase [Rhodospirillaceae bacterium]
MPDLIAIGEPLVELAAESAGRLGDVDRFRYGWGGDTANFVLAAVRLGGACGYVTRVGRDAFGDAFVAMLETNGVDASRVIFDEEHHTGLYFVTYTGERRHRFDYVRRGSAASHLTGADIDPDYVASARVLHVSGISQAISRSCAEAARVAMEIARKAGTTVSYDANVRPALGTQEALRDNFEAALALADVVFLSEEDAAHLFGEGPLEDVLDRVLGERPRLAVVKLGADGCVIKSDAGERLHVPAWRIEAVDATGAGDAFSAGFVLSLLRDAELAEAGRYANAVGALTATGVGAIAPQPSYTEITAFMEEQLSRLR